ncbi:MAG: RNA polymerase sigma factor [Blautia sp.]
MTMLEALYRDYRDELIRWCSTMTQDRSTAEDLVQEAFWKAMNHEAMLQTMSVSQCRAWLYQVVKTSLLTVHGMLPMKQ